MRYQNHPWVLTVSLILAFPAVSAYSQVPSRPTPGRPNPGSGLGVRNTPVVNPAPSLTPSQVLNPRGSLDTGQVLNPSPSLNRPRTGVASPTANKNSRSNIGAAADSTFRSKKPFVAQAEDLPRQSSQRKSSALPLGVQLLQAVVALDERIGQVAPDTDWPERLSLDLLRTVPLQGEQPSSDEARKKMDEILAAYREIARDEGSVEVNSLPEFKRTLSLIEVFMTPRESRRGESGKANPGSGDVRQAFGLLHQQLKKHKNGAPWIEYLSLPENLDETGGQQTAEVDAQISKLLGRFNKLVADRTYLKVTSLPGFDPAHAALQAMAKRP